MAKIRLARLAGWVLLCLVCSATLATGVALRPDRESRRADPRGRPYMLSSLDCLRWSALGNEALVRDLIWIDMLQAQTARRNQDRALVVADDALATVLQLEPPDPRFFRWLAIALATPPDPQAVARSLAFAQAALKRVPGDGGLHRQIGLLLYLSAPAAGSAAAELRRQATNHFMAAAQAPGNSIAPAFVVGLLREQEQIAEALRLLEQQYAKAPPEQRAALEVQLDLFADEPNAAVLRERLHRWQADSPYLPLTLFEQMGPARPPAWPADLLTPQLPGGS